MYYRAILFGILSLGMLIPLSSSAQDSLNVTKVGELYDFWNSARDITIQDHYAYVADLSAGVHVMDIDNPSQPNRIYTIQGIGSCREIDSGDDLLAVGQDDRIRIYSLAEPSEPAYGGDFITDAPVTDLKIVGTSLYAITTNGNFYIVDISDPQNPTHIGSITTSPVPEGMAVIDNYVFTVGSYSSFIIDISTPASPTTTYLPSIYGSNILVQGNYAYVAGGNYLRILDISAPLDPTDIGCCEGLEEAYSVIVSENYAYVGVADC